jgi:hypothetical protein
MEVVHMRKLFILLVCFFFFFFLLCMISFHRESMHQDMRFLASISSGNHALRSHTTSQQVILIWNIAKDSIPKYKSILFTFMHVQSIELSCQFEQINQNWNCLPWSTWPRFKGQCSQMEPNASNQVQNINKIIPINITKSKFVLRK